MFSPHPSNHNLPYIDFQGLHVNSDPVVHLLLPIGLPAKGLSFPPSSRSICMPYLLLHLFLVACCFCFFACLHVCWLVALFVCFRWWLLLASLSSSQWAGGWRLLCWQPITCRAKREGGEECNGSYVCGGSEGRGHVCNGGRADFINFVHSYLSTA